jgi:hypothetical protein
MNSMKITVDVLKNYINSIVDERIKMPYIPVLKPNGGKLLQGDNALSIRQIFTIHRIINDFNNVLIICDNKTYLKGIRAFIKETYKTLNINDDWHYVSNNNIYPSLSCKNFIARVHNMILIEQLKK